MNRWSQGTFATCKKKRFFPFFFFQNFHINFTDNLISIKKFLLIKLRVDFNNNPNFDTEVRRDSSGEGRRVPVLTCIGNTAKAEDCRRSIPETQCVIFNLLHAISDCLYMRILSQKSSKEWQWVKP